MKLTTQQSLILHALLLSNFTAASPAVSVKRPPLDLIQPLVSPSWDRRNLLSSTNILKSHSTHPSLPRNLQVPKDDDVDCPENPFMWKIINNETRQLMGIGIGTMHVPPPLITSTDSWMSITNALKDVCTVYGEYNPFDPVETAQLLQCINTVNQDAATIMDIPEGEVRDAFLAKAEVIAKEIHGGGNDANASGLVVAETVAKLTTEPLLTGFLVTVLFRNSPEYVAYEDSLMDNPKRDQLLLPIDIILQASARPGPAGLETVEAQCNGLKSIIITKEDLAANFTQYYSTMLLQALEDQSLSAQMNAYRCGNVEHFKEVYLQQLDGAEEALTDELTDDRNVLMVESMVTIMEDSPTLPMFAVGLGHWIIGDKTLDILLADYGYSVERVDSHGADELEDLTNEMCGTTTSSSSSSGTNDSHETSGTEESFTNGSQADTDAAVVLGELESAESSSVTNAGATGSALAGTVFLFVLAYLGIM